MTAIHIMLDLETWGTRPGNDIRSIGACVFDPISGAVSKPCQTCDGGKSYGTISTFSGDCSDCQNTRMERGYGDVFYLATDNKQVTASLSLKHGVVCVDPDTLEPLIGHMDGTGPYRKYPLTRDPETVKWWREQSAEAVAAFTNPVDLRDACLRFAIWLESLNSVKPTPRYPDYTAPEAVRIWSNGPHFDVAILAAVYQAVGLPVPWHYRAPRDMRTITDAAGMTRDDFRQFDHGTPHHALHDAISQASIVCEAYKRLSLAK